MLSQVHNDASQPVSAQCNNNSYPYFGCENSSPLFNLRYSNDGINGRFSYM